jgi:hypothetical protein
MDIVPFKFIEDGLAHPCRLRSAFSYAINGEQSQQLSAGKSEHVLSGYDPAQHNLSLKLEFSVANTAALFDGEQAVACPGSTLQVALVWESKDSGRRGVGEKRVLITQASKLKGAQLLADFPPSSIRGRFSVTASLFLHKAAPRKKIQGIATQEGSWLGDLWGPVTFSTDGDGSLFPLVEDHEAKASDAPWRLLMDWGAEPLTRPFDKESFAVCVNMKHRDVAAILPELDDNNLPSPAMKEILSSALTLFMLRVKEDKTCWDKIRRSSPEVIPGSIADAASHFLAQSRCRSEEPHELLAAIRSTLSDVA